MTIESLLYFGGIALWSAFLAYMVIGKLTPKKAEHHDEPIIVSVMPRVAPSATDTPRAEAPVHLATPVQSEGFNPYEGFKSFQTGKELTVEDIVKGLSR